MKLTACLLFGLAVLTAAPASAQPSPTPPPAGAPTEPRLTKFDLDFPGGTPGELVAAIQKATGKPVNAIIPSDYADRHLPALKMGGVDVAQLFEGLLLASIRNDSTGFGEVQMGFRSQAQPRPTDDSVWYFFVQERRPPSECRFYLLTPYLDRGLTVDDITTAIQTAWKMQGDTAAPTMKFHKETRLLIVVGDSFHLMTVEYALNALRAPEPKAKPPLEKPANPEEKKP